MDPVNARQTTARLMDSANARQTVNAKRRSWRRARGIAGVRQATSRNGLLTHDDEWRPIKRRLARGNHGDLGVAQGVRRGVAVPHPAVEIYHQVRRFAVIDRPETAHNPLAAGVEEGAGQAGDAFALVESALTAFAGAQHHQVGVEF